MNWETTGTLVAILGTLVGIPLSVMTLYLRAIRDTQVNRDRENSVRLHGVEQHIRSVERQVEGVERDYTTKEEWLRESMLARKQLERLTEMVARMQVRLEDSDGLAAQLGRATSAMVDLARGLVQAASNVGQRPQKES